MYSKDFLDQVGKTDTVLAQRLRGGRGIRHLPVENASSLTETRDFTDEEVGRLDRWIHG